MQMPLTCGLVMHFHLFGGDVLARHIDVDALAEIQSLFWRCNLDRHCLTLPCLAKLTSTRF